MLFQTSYIFHKDLAPSNFHIYYLFVDGYLIYHNDITHY
jgi:hypothetical protein